MDEDQKEWVKKYYECIGGKEILRFMGAFIGWLLISILISVIVFRSTFIFFIFLSIPILIAYLSGRRRWKPAYHLLRRIYGNPNIPMDPMPWSKEPPIKQPRPWWSYLPSAWGIILVIILVYFATEYFIRHGY
jgi:hypothetical protein